MEERKGTYNEDGEYVMTDEEAEEELKILNPLLIKLNEDIDGIFLMDEINEHIKKYNHITNLKVWNLSHYIVHQI